MQLPAIHCRPCCIPLYILSHVRFLRYFLVNNVKHRSQVPLLHHFPASMSLFCAQAFRLLPAYSSLYASVFLLCRRERILQDLHWLFPVCIRFLPLQWFFPPDSPCCHHLEELSLLLPFSLQSFLFSRDFLTPESYGLHFPVSAES